MSKNPAGALGNKLEMVNVYMDPMLDSAGMSRNLVGACGDS